MTRDEVDAVMAGHAVREYKEEREYDSHGRALERKGIVTVEYQEKPGATEGDHSVDAHFDENDYLVGMTIDMYMN